MLGDSCFKLLLGMGQPRQREGLRAWAERGREGQVFKLCFKSPG